MPQGLVLTGGSGPVINPLASAWKVAVISAGGTVSDGRLLAVSNYITALQGASIYSVLDRLFLLAPEGGTITQQATIDIVALASADISSGPNFTTKGVAGNGTVSFFNTNYAPNGSGNYTLAAASLFQYVQTLSTLAVAGASNGGTAESALYSPFSDNNFYPRVNDEGGSAGGPFTTGFFVGDRAAGVVTGAHNGVDLAPVSVAAVGLPGFSIYIGGENNSGVSLGQGNTSRFGIWGAGGTLGATKRAALWTATQAYLTAIGAL